MNAHIRKLNGHTPKLNYPDPASAPLQACYSMLRACYSVLQRATGVLQRGSSPLGDTCEFVLGIMTSLFYYDEFVLGMRPFRFGMCPLRFVYVCSSFGFFCCLVRGCVYIGAYVRRERERGRERE